MKSSLNAAKVLFLVGALSCVPMASAQDSVTGAGGTHELNCDGRTASIEGSSNEVTVTGRCQTLEIVGASNVVTVDMAKGGVIKIVGADNKVRWKTPDGSRPRINATGAGNQVSAAGR